jgi:uncharacterized membrane protein YqgA involved in biofilm formation
MTGTLVNAAAIVVFGLAALIFKRQLSARTQEWLRLALGAATVWIGLLLVWRSVNGSALQVLKQLGLLLVALILGRLLGRLLRLQKLSNRLGRAASARLAAAEEQPAPLGEGLLTCTILFCAAPLGWVGPVVDGLSGFFLPLLVKALMDGLAAMAFAPAFRWAVVLSALPVLAWQGTLALLAKSVLPWLAAQHLVDPITATAGLLISFVSLIIFRAVRVETADYLPALVLAPGLFWLLGR